MTSRLELREEIGRGGTCAVHRAVLCGAHGTQRTVAVKRLLPERRDDPAALDLFLREAKLSTRVSHPRLVQALELREQDGEYLLVTEWIDGCTLDALRAPLPPNVVATLGQRVCEALAYLHGLEGSAVIHRDVSPSNVFLTRTGEVKLADLGIAHCGDDESTRALTEGFGAPEQRAGSPVDARADIYALGRTLETLTDDEALREVLARATREDPEARFESSEALADALRTLHPPLDASELRPHVVPLPARPRPVLDSAVRSILRPNLGEPSATPPLASRRTLREPAAPPRSRALGLMPWIVAAVLASVGLWITLPARVQPGAAASAVTESPESPADAPRAEGPAPEPAQDTRTERTDAHPPPASAARRAPAPALSQGTTKTVPIAVTGERPQGTLTVGCTPWAAVKLDGSALGNTPLRRVRVSAGAHELTFVHPPTGQSRVVAIELPEDEDLTVIVDLNRDEVKMR